MPRPILVVLLLLGGFAGRSPGAEHWADPGMKVTDGLHLWLDASRLEAAWKRHGKPPLTHTAALDVWFDASGQGMHLVQRVQGMQPRYVSVGGRAVVRFDGKDDCLGCSGFDRSLDGFTGFLVVAPRSNAGGFRGFLAAHERGKNDYTTGFNLDMAAAETERFSQLNIEGKGFGGMRNLMTTSWPFGEFHTLEFVSQGGPNGVRLFLDGQPAGQRARDPGTLRMDNLVLGGRCYSNSSEPPFLSGFLDGDIAEVMLYNRSLDAKEREAVRTYLTRKHAGLGQALAVAGQQGGRLLQPIANPPPVQMLVPGFAVRQLPVELTNLNNVRYRPDGKLFALAYNGDIVLLSDTDGDGLEDKVERFWESKGRLRGPIGIALTPPGYTHGNGLFVPSKGKLSLIVDVDGDDRADKEIIVAQGWKEIFTNVDALGAAIARDGSIYFGLGTANFANGYLIEKDGKSRYDLHSERGTILKVSPDFSKREIVCTGIRFPVALAFNRHGDLFATDQEGATWLANGNPFDELLHIQPGRHYGFPPRHPRHLPGVVDEPSVFDYGPQHQSTCGLGFNEPVNGGPVFGPAWWEADALICGESRGRLYRTQLVKTAHGYVAQNHLFARLNMLTVDACVSPRGDLVVATHSGPPDWGTGPLGKGKLYKIAYRDKDDPQPVRAWAAGPHEVRIAFDRPLDPARLRNLAKQAAIEYGPYVSAADRFEVLAPPYAVVKQQLATPRHDLPVLAAAVTADRRTLVLTTAPHPEAVHYAVTLPGLGRREPAKGELPQVSALDLAYDLCGVTAAWQESAGAQSWSGWLPHLDLAVSQAFTMASAEQEPLWAALPKPGQLTLRTQLDLWKVLRPAVQPGAQLDYTPPPEQVTLLLKASAPITVKAPAAAVAGNGSRAVTLRVTPKEAEPLALEVVLPTGKDKTTLDIAYFTNEDPRNRALPLRRHLLPWAAMKPRPQETLAQRRIPELEGGSWTRGREVFFSEQAQCAKCHEVRGQGGRIGPDLSNLVHRDYASVHKDMLDPSAALNPDYITYTVTLKDGRLLTGVPRTLDDGRIVLGDNTGKETTLARGEIEQLTPAPISTMPKDLDKTLGPERLRDLLTFLLTEPLTPAPLERTDAPPPRSRAEVEAVLAGAPPSAGVQKHLRVVLVAGPKDHGLGEHDYPLWQRRWVNLLGLADGVTVGEALGWPTPRQLETADVLVFYSANPAWTAAKAKDLDAFLERGGGLVYLHWAVNGQKAAAALAERIGLAAGPGALRFRHGPLELTFTDNKHPITRNFDRVKLVDESYWQMVGDLKQIQVLATAVEESQPRPLLWTRAQGKGRVFVCIPGHYTWTFDDPLYRILVLRGLCWTARQPADRLRALAAIGARITE